MLVAHDISCAFFGRGQRQAPEEHLGTSRVTVIGHLCQCGAGISDPAAPCAGVQRSTLTTPLGIPPFVRPRPVGLRLTVFPLVCA